MANELIEQLQDELIQSLLQKQAKARQLAQLILHLQEVGEPITAELYQLIELLS